MPSCGMGGQTARNLHRGLVIFPQLSRYTGKTGLPISLPQIEQNALFHKLGE